MNLLLLVSLLILQSGMLPKKETDDVVQAVGAALRDRYLDPAMGLRLADMLESKRVKAEFSAPASEGDLADQLTKVLQAETHDRHLRVRSPGAPRPMVHLATEARPAMVGRVDMLPNRVGYLEVTNFGSTDGAEFDAAIAKLKDARALIIDLGKNPGGTSEAIQYLSTYFFAKKTHLLDSIARGMNTPTEHWTLDTVPGQRLDTIPVYILTSHFTFSAAESFAFGLKAISRAVIVGERTGGGGHFGDITQLPHGFTMFVPVGQTYDPRTGKGWESDGVQPDIAVRYADALQAALTAYSRNPTK